MNPTIRRCLAAALLLAAPALSQSLELRNGEVLLGRVVALDAASATVEAGYPKPQQRTVARDEVEPRSWFALQQQRSDAGSADAHWQLAELAETMQLPSHAVAEFAEVARLDPPRRADADRRIAAIRTRVAAMLLDDAKGDAAADRWAEAKLASEVVIDRYADTPSLAGAQELERQAIARLRAAAKTRAAEATDMKKAIAAAEAHEQKALAMKLATSGGIGATVKETKAREQVIDHLEHAWAAIGTVAADAPETGALRTRIQQELRDHYVALATNLLQRRSLDMATLYNGKACSLDPEGGGCRNLQNLIVQARLTYGNR